MKYNLTEGITILQVIPTPIVNSLNWNLQNIFKECVMAMDTYNLVLFPIEFQ